MKKIICFFLTVLMCFSVSAIPAYAQDNTLIISASHISHKVSPSLYGVSLEDNSYGIDGGLVAEFVNNGSFEYENAPEAFWEFDGVEPILSSSDPMNENNTSYEQLRINSKGTIKNLGFTEFYSYKSFNYDDDSAKEANMSFKEGATYEFSCYIKNIDFEGSISVCLDSKSNARNLVKLSAASISEYDWTELKATLESGETEKGGLSIVFKGTGSLQLDQVSLVPSDSYGYGTEEWKYTALRPDLFDALKRLNPSFIRFPGGCNALGSDIDHQNSWKSTIGIPSQRSQVVNVFANDDNGFYYNNSNNMGYHEYFQLCEDLNAIAVPVVSAGISCQDRADYDLYETANKKLSMTDSQWRAYLITDLGYDEKDEKGMAEYTEKINALGIKSPSDYEEYLNTVSLNSQSSDFKNYTQDVLDLIEYANGDALTTYWGALRAANGHREPFNVKYIAIGSESYGDIYWRNFDELNRAIKNEYPEVTVIASLPEGDKNAEAALATVNENYATGYADEHITDGSSYFFEHNDKYDSYDRDGAGVAVFEYAYSSDSIGKMITKNNAFAAANEAVFMTGLERNSDVVKMSSHANTLSKINANSAETSLIWFTSDDIVYTPSYYTRMIFANNVGTDYIDTSFASDSVYQSVTVDPDKQVIYVKLANLSSTSQRVAINLDGFDAINFASCQSVSNGYKTAANEIDKQYVAPVDNEIKTSEASLDVTIDSYSANVVRIAYGNNNGDGVYKLPTDINLSAKKYIPSSAKVVIAALCVSISVGGVAGYMLYTKSISKKRKGKNNGEK